MVTLWSPKKSFYCRGVPLLAPTQSQYPYVIAKKNSEKVLGKFLPVAGIFLLLL